MAATANPPVYLGLFSRATSRTARVPWHIWTGVAAVTSSSIGIVWDVSWHGSVGRDTFWTPAHMMIYLCGVLAGVVGTFLVYQCTFNRDAQLRASSVSVFGLRAPLGVFLAGWGGLAMLTSAPFDQWWHSAYGLDVKIVSPPHTLLILGIRAVATGMMFLILGAMNRALAADEAEAAARLQRLFLYLGGLMIGAHMFFVRDYTLDLLLHRGIPYVVMGLAMPVLFAAVSGASRHRYAATIVAAIYMLSVIAEILILPLVPAEPKLGPVFNPITHLIPEQFPILLIVPAFALDLLWLRTAAWKTWQVAAASGVVFVGLLLAVEWPFASFLMSPRSANRFFGTGYFTYNTRPDDLDRMRVFFTPDHGVHLASRVLIAMVCAFLSTWLGLAFGRWMRGVQR
jgi:hypothetical protein